VIVHPHIERLRQLHQRRHVAGALADLHLAHIRLADADGLGERHLRQAALAAPELQRRRVCKIRIHVRLADRSRAGGNAAHGAIGVADIFQIVARAQQRGVCRAGDRHGVSHMRLHAV
jgi:hypothetical protein